MEWTKEPGEPGFYVVMFAGHRTVAELWPAQHKDGSKNLCRVSLIGSDEFFRVAEVTAWCRIPNPPPLPADLR